MSVMTSRARRLVLCFSLVTVLLALNGVGAALAAETMALHIPSQTMILPNGLTVVVSPKDKLPIAAISVRFKVGSAYDPEDKAGLADMTARLLDKGTTTRTATAIAEELDFLGARLDASAGGTGSTVSLSLLAKDIDRGLNLLADILQDSRFETAELERERTQHAVANSTASGESTPGCVRSVSRRAVRRASITPPDFRLCVDGVANHP